MSGEPNNAGRLGPASVRAPQKFVAGVALVGICAFVLWAMEGLDQGTIKFMGPAMFPRALAILLGIGGVVLIGDSLLRDGEALAKWSLRGPHRPPLLRRRSAPRQPSAAFPRWPRACSFRRPMLRLPRACPISPPRLAPGWVIRSARL